MIDVVVARTKVVDNLEDHGFRPRDADPTDFQFGDDTSLRFKVGTSYGEITVSVWKPGAKFTTMRSTTMEGVVELNHEIDRLIAEFFNGRDA